MFAPAPNSHIEALPPSAMAFGGGAFGDISFRCSHGGDLTRRGSLEAPLSRCCEGTARRHARTRALGGHGVCWRLDLGPPRLQNCEKDMSVVYKTLSLQPERTKMPSLCSPQGLCTDSSQAQECSSGTFQLILILQLKCHLFSENFPVTLLQVGPSSAPQGLLPPFTTSTGNSGGVVTTFPALTAVSADQGTWGSQASSADCELREGWDTSAGPGATPARRMHKH